MLNELHIIDDESYFVEMGRVFMNIRLLLGDLFYDIGSLDGIAQENWMNTLKKAGLTAELQAFVEEFVENRQEMNDE